MHYLFTALRAEAAVLIREWNLKPSDRLNACYENGSAVLSVTGTGPLSASASCGAVLAAYGCSDNDIVINAGIAAAVNGGEADRIYAVNKIHDIASGRDYYPDLIPLSSCPEAMLYTGAVPFVKEEAAQYRNDEPVVLYDMEAAGIMHAASGFLPPHRIRVLKLVSDFGDTRTLQFDPAWAETIAEAVQRDLSRMETVPPCPQKQTPDCDALAGELHATTAMKRRLEQALRYAELAGLDWQKTAAEYRKAGLLPAKDKQAGIQLLERLIYDLQN